MPSFLLFLAKLAESLGDTEGEICNSFGAVARLWGRAIRNTFRELRSPGGD